MVTFPEGYGFEPSGKAQLMQDQFLIEIGRFVWVGHEWVGYGKKRNRSPWRFEGFGSVSKEKGEGKFKGWFVPSMGTPSVEGSLQQVVTAMCTIHRMKGSK